jgi:hypothetical protein
VFVAAAIVTFWRRKQARPVAATAEAPAAATSQPPRRSKQRKARAS